MEQSSVPFRHLLHWLLLSLFIFLIYYPCKDAILLDDGLSGITAIEEMGWQGYLHSYQLRGLYQGHFGLIYCVYFLFGDHTTGWQLALALYNGLTFYLLFIFLQKLFYKTTDGNAIALTSIFLILILPQQNEIVNYAATTHYTTIMLSFLCGLIYLLGYQFWINITFILALYSLELALIVPALHLIFYLLYRNRVAFKRYKFLALFQASQILIYILLYYRKNKTIIPSRDGTAEIDFTHLPELFCKQVVDLFGLTPLMKFPSRESFYKLFEHPIIIFITIVLLLLPLIWHRSKKEVWIILFLACAFTIPFCKFYNTMFYIELDRFSYFMSCFFIPYFVYVIYSIRFKIVRGIFIILMLIYAIGLYKTITQKKVCARLRDHIIKEYPTDRKKYILCNLPSYCGNYHLFRDTSRIRIALQHYKNITSPPIVASNYYAYSLKDTFECTKNSNEYIITPRTDGVWFTSFNEENQIFSVKIGASTSLILKDTTYQPLLYSNGKFKEL